MVVFLSAGLSNLAFTEGSGIHASPADFNLRGTTTQGGFLKRSPHALILSRENHYSRHEQALADDESPSPCSYDTLFPSISRSPDARMTSQPSFIFNRAGLQGTTIVHDRQVIL